MSQAQSVTVTRGDGIGPGIMDATLRVLETAGAELNIEEIAIGEKVYEQGFTSGTPTDAWESLRRTKVFRKAPITTPQGGGYKSLNVTVRKTLGLFANVRPCVSNHPFVETKHSVMASGLHGVVKLAKSGFSSQTVLVMLVTVAAATLVPVWSFFLLRMKLDAFNSAAIAATLALPQANFGIYVPMALSNTLPLQCGSRYPKVSFCYQTLSAVNRSV